MAEQIVVRGGRGGSVTVSVEDLRLAAAALTESAGHLSLSAHRLLGAEVAHHYPAAASVGAGEALWRVDDSRVLAMERLRVLSEGLQVLADNTRRAADRYWFAEGEARIEVALADGESAVSRALTQYLLREVLRRAQVVSRGFLPGVQLPLLDDGVLGPVVDRSVAPGSSVPLRDLESLMQSQANISGEPMVRVIEVPQPDGSSAWVVQIPGTISWAPSAGSIPHDVTADVRAMLQESVVLTQAAVVALKRAQADRGRAGAGEPVMITGHSLGGIAAMVIASDRQLQQSLNITHVQTAGSPVAQFRLPDGVQALSLEHSRDAVVHADLGPNPATENWTTVTASRSGHGAQGYVQTARVAAAAAADGSEPALAAWSASAAPFLSAVPSTRRGAPGGREPGGREPDRGQRDQDECRATVRDFTVERRHEARS